MIARSTGCLPQTSLSVSIFLLFIFIHFAPLKAYAAPVYGGQLVLATTSDPKSFNDILAKETSTSMVTDIIFEGLTKTNVFTLKVEPHLAQRWEVSADGQTWTFYLRRDVRWSDGHPFTADDVVFTFNDLIFNPDIPSSARDVFSIDGKNFAVEKIDDHTVRFVLPVKFAPFLRGMGQLILPKHKLEQAVKEKKFNFTWGIDTPVEEIVGTGAFMLAEYRPGERIVFKRNPRYWKRSETGDALPYLDKLIFLIVQNADTALLKFMDGELDYYSMRGMDYPLLKPKERMGDFTVFDVGPDFGSSFIVFNQNAGINEKTGQPYIPAYKLAWFKDLEFRKAVAHAIDKRKIIDILMNGLGYPQDAAMSPSAGFFYNKNVITYEYDLKKAKEILTKAGYIDRDGDGVIEDVSGHPVSFNLYTNTGSTQRVQMAAIMRQDLQSLGMQVNFNGLEFNSLVGKLTSTFDWDAIILGLTGGIEPHFGKNVWHSSGQLHMWHPKQKEPATAWEKRIDQIFDDAVQELDEDKRRVLYDEFQMIVSQQLPVVYTTLSSTLFAVRNKFGNLKPVSYGGAFHNLEELFIQPGQK